MGCLVTFGLNKFLSEEEDNKNDLSSGIVIEKIILEEGMNVLPASLCTIQEESEIVLVPGTKLIFIEKKNVSINDLYDFNNINEFIDERSDNLSLNDTKREWKRALHSFKKILIVQYETALFKINV